MPTKERAAAARAKYSDRKRYVKIDEAAAYIDVNPITIRKLITNGKIRGYRSGTRILRVDLNEIDALLAGETQNGAAS